MYICGEGEENTVSWYGYVKRMTKDSVADCIKVTTITVSDHNKGIVNGGEGGTID